MNIQQVTLGKTGPSVSRIGLGAMGMSHAYGPSDDTSSIATIHAAIDAGVNLIDTGDFYGSGHNEMLIGRALRERARDDVQLSVKFGGLVSPDGGFVGFDTRPVAMKNFLTYSLNRLGVDHIDVYRPARLDPAVPIEETIGAIAEMVEAGHVRHIGLSEMGSHTIRRAAAVHPIADLQIEYSLLSRGIEADILSTTRELGIGITAYGVLSRGLLSNSIGAGATLAPSDYRAHSPRFRGDNLTKNLELVEALATIADQREVSVAQLAIAWVLAQGDDIVPIVGTQKVSRLRDSLGALDIRLSETELDAIEAAVPADAAAGGRYDDAHMAMLDSER